ncbi:hypothetical protein H5410_002679 [Solanum commersonii]|uniref:Uncharacterized protein n=1 Tax=Solanum commersonii TaxID=4109 RepID=A0A9J6B300_SOLCO|nr:hypothetical protein H5410_002679 [Solanum commersonii]
MNQSAILKKKGSIPNKAQSPLKNRIFDMQYRSSVELKKEFEDLIPQQGKSKLFGRKSVIQSSSREELSTSHMIAGKGQNKPRLFQSGESIQEKGIKLPMHNFRFQTSSKKGVKRKLVLPATSVDQFLKKQQIHKEHDIDHDLPNKKEVKKSVIPATSLDQFQKQQGIVIGDERKQYMHAPSIHEHTKGLDDLEGQEEIGEDECDIGEEVDTDCSTKGISKKKKVRGQTTCKHIHARNLEEREEVTFDKGQAVGPTDKIVSELTNFIGTISRNPRFINLMYTSWHAVPKDIKKRMWEYINDMLAKRPDDIRRSIPRLIEYWKHPFVQRVNSQNRKNNDGGIEWDQLILQECSVALRATKQRGTITMKCLLQLHTKAGKEIGGDTKVAIRRVWKGATGDLGAMAVGDNKFSEKDEETNKLKQKHANEIGLNVQDIPGVVGSNLVSPVDASSAGKRPKYSTFLSSTHD